MFTVPVIGDAHFKQDARQPDRLASVDQIVRECLLLPVGLWAVPGDLYDAGSDVFSRNAWVDRIRQMANVAPVVICYGNHDRDGDLYLLSQIGAKWPIHVIDRPQTIHVRTPQGPTIAVFVLPYPHPSGFVAAGTPTADVVGIARTALDAIFMEAGARLEAARKMSQPTLFVGHANVGGSRMSTGQPLIGKEIELDEQLLMRLGDCPKVLNHIHLPQEIGGAILTGSITAMSWGETEAKRYVRIDYAMDTSDADDVLGTLKQAGLFAVPMAMPWKWTALSCPLDTPQLVLVEARFENMTFTYDVDPSTVSAKAHVRVRVRFQETERQFFEYGKSQVVEAFAHVAKLQIEPICEADRGLRAPEVAAAKTLPEKLRAWCEANGEAVPEDLEAAVGDLETKPADVVIAEFRSRMNALLQEEG